MKKIDLASIDIRSLRHIVELAKKKNFSRAADSLFITQPALTKSIKSTENQLGLLLFDRLPNNISPTSYCKIIVEYTEQVFLKMEEYNNRLNSVSNCVTGNVSFGVGPFVASMLMEKTILKMIRGYPDVNICPIVDVPDILLKMLHNNEIDFFIGDREGLEDQAHLSITHMGALDIHLFCRSGHPLLREKKSSQIDFIKYPLVCPHESSFRLSRLFLSNNPENIDNEEYCENAIRIYSSSHTLNRSIICQTDYLTLGPAPIFADEVENGEITTLSLNEFQNTPTFSPVIVQTKQRTLSPPAKILTDYFKQSYLELTESL